MLFATDMFIYDTLRKYIKLIDWVLLDSSSGKSLERKEAILEFEKLAAFFSQVADEENEEMESYMILVILKSIWKEKGDVLSKCKSLSESLRKGKIQSKEKDQLEKIAEILEQESIERKPRNLRCIELSKRALEETETEDVTHEFVIRELGLHEKSSS